MVRETGVLSVPLSSPQISHGLDGDLTRPLRWQAGDWLSELRNDLESLITIHSTEDKF